MPLQDLPSEILCRIFQLLCYDSTDDRNNFRLLRISKGISAAARPAVYSHIAFPWNELGIRAFHTIALSRRANFIRSVGFWENLGPPSWRTCMPTERHEVEPCVKLLQLCFESFARCQRLQRLVIGEREDVTEFRRGDLRGLGSRFVRDQLRPLRLFLLASDKPKLTELHMIHWSQSFSMDALCERLTHEEAQFGDLTHEKMANRLSKLDTLVITLPYANYAIRGFQNAYNFPSLGTFKLNQTSEMSPGSMGLQYVGASQRLAVGGSSPHTIMMNKYQGTAEMTDKVIRPSFNTLTTLSLQAIKLVVHCPTFEKPRDHQWCQLFRQLSKFPGLVTLSIRNLQYSRRHEQLLGGFGHGYMVPSATSRPGYEIPALLTTHDLADIESLGSLIATVNSRRRPNGLPEFCYTAEHAQSALRGRADNALALQSARVLEDIADQLTAHTKQLEDLSEIEWGRDDDDKSDYQTLVDERETMRGIMKTGMMKTSSLDPHWF